MIDFMYDSWEKKTKQWIPYLSSEIKVYTNWSMRYLKNAAVELRCDSQEKAYNLLYTLKLLEEKYSKTKVDSSVQTINNSNTSMNTSRNEIGNDIINQLNQLKNLLNKGVITDEEFNDLKSRVIKA